MAVRPSKDEYFDELETMSAGRPPRVPRYKS